MYSATRIENAVKLIDVHRSIDKVISLLNYPSPQVLVTWVRQLCANKVRHQRLSTLMIDDLSWIHHGTCAKRIQKAVKSPSTLTEDDRRRIV